MTIIGVIYMGFLVLISLAVVSLLLAFVFVQLDRPKTARIFLILSLLAVILLFVFAFGLCFY